MTVLTIALYQSPCGDSFHFNVVKETVTVPQTVVAGINPLAGILFISTNQMMRRAIPKACVSIPLRGFFSFQLMFCLWYTERAKSINPLAGILFISTRPGSRMRNFASTYQSPCGDSFHFNIPFRQDRARNRRVSIPLRGFFSFQRRLDVVAHRKNNGRINPLAGILFISTDEKVLSWLFRT